MLRGFEVCSDLFSFYYNKMMENVFKVFPKIRLDLFRNIRHLHIYFEYYLIISRSTLF